ncbi:DNA (cytosine-5-)-methyltransferase [Candidatus Saccharibacteria bacterium CG2_30_41_52]|nr:MAG: DNA (cytosine-5-)-methyltransferase [Candidatus Saccharibacteria bacterium CG2_30_41_52]PJE66156.1 MAG: DNA (cytosine-5-)-methyltransferase [Candidatus Saccharibacteria bacterium CG10_big_fil_rev_8_21_14_0_10_41_32]
MKKIEAIDLFCGIGGLTYGLREAGVDVIAGLDNDKTCRYAYEKNNDAKFIEADIANYDFNEMKSMFSKNSIKVLVGCAPCQTFSSNTFKIDREKKENDKRWTLINYFTEAARVIQPEVISMENVRGLTKTQVFKDFVSDLEGLGYKVDYEVLYLPEYGVPQNRSRMVLVGSRVGDIKVPKKTHNKGDYITVGEVIRDLPQIGAGEISLADPLHRSKNLSDLNIERLKQSKPKGTWHDWDPVLLPNCYRRASGATFTAVYGRMSWDDVSPTITTQFFSYGSGRFGHPEQNRALSIREGAIIQTFPKHYDFGMNMAVSTVGRHIGNAVPPRLGEVLGNAIKEHLYASV